MAVVGGLLNAPLSTGLAGASGGDCGTATTPAATVACTQQLFTTAVETATTAPKSTGGVSLPGPIVGQTSLLNLVDQTTAQAVQQAENCVSQTDPTCALIVRVANQEAQSIATLATTCVSGSNDVCNQLKQLATGEISALVTLGNQCVGGNDPTCNSLFGTVSQLADEAVTCTIGPLGPAAPTNLPDPLVITIGGGGDGAGLPDPTVTCQQVKDAAGQLVDGCVAGATGASGECGLAIVAVEKSPCLNVPDQADCTQATTEPPPAPVLGDADPHVTYPAGVLGGSLQLGTGATVANVPISFYVDPANTFAETEGDSGSGDSLGTTTTDSNGNFSFTLPPLDSFASSVANSNTGVLNVLEVAAVTAAIPNSASTPSVIEQAQAVVPITVGGSPDYWMSQPTALTLTPVPDGALGTDAALSSVPTVPQTYDPTDPSVDPAVNYQPTNASLVTSNGIPVSAAQYNPWVVNGVDYRNAVPVTSPASVDGGPQDCNGGIILDKYKVINSGDMPVIVGEGHAYWDATLAFSYGETADTSIQAGFSFDGTNWSVGGSEEVHNHHSDIDQSPFYGPYRGWQFTEPFHFTKTQFWYHCDNYQTGTVRWTQYQVAPTTCKWNLKAGKSVSKYDGGDNYLHAKSSYQGVIGNGYEHAQSDGTAYHYSAAFNAFGASLGASSDHDDNAEQRIKAGWKGDSSEDPHGLTHDVWGNNDYWADAQIFYSY